VTGRGSLTAIDDLARRARILATKSDRELHRLEPILHGVGLRQHESDVVRTISCRLETGSYSEVIGIVPARSSAEPSPKENKERSQSCGTRIPDAEVIDLGCWGCSGDDGDSRELLVRLVQQLGSDRLVTEERRSRREPTAQRGICKGLRRTWALAFEPGRGLAEHQRCVGEPGIGRKRVP
jgi:hypothetical protein